ncbi:MAG: sigma-54 interaction domain-containing protein [bacterium]
MMFEKMVSNNKAMLDLFELIKKVSRTDCTILIEGESGTGKELVARAIHRQSSRKHKGFYAINCSAIPESLLESELFGHVRGAFSGAVTNQIGIFEGAHEGTVFFDEIGDVSPGLQVKLLRVIQEGEFKIIGSNRIAQVNIRFISATNKRLNHLVQEKIFREDLYYRLNVIHITLPPLRERMDDLPLLASYFLRKSAAKAGKAVNTISPEAMAKLGRYSWPGNIRELENMVESAIIMARDNVLAVEDFPMLDEKVAANPRKTRSSDTPFYVARGIFEKHYLQDLLQRCNWNLSAASQMGEISRRSLTQKAKRYGLIS